MSLEKSALLELTGSLRSADDNQLMRQLLHTILQALIGVEAAQHIGADPHERTEARKTYATGPPSAITATTTDQEVIDRDVRRTA